MYIFIFNIVGNVRTQEVMGVSVMNQYGNPTSRSGLVVACFRLLKDPERSKIDKVVMMLWWAYIASPIDFVAEAFAGPVGLIDDAGVGARFVYLVVIASTRYRQARVPA